MTTESDFIQAIGLMSTIKPDMEVNVNDPVGMARAVAAEVNALRAQLAERDRQLEAARGWEKVAYAFARVCHAMDAEHKEDNWSLATDKLWADATQMVDVGNHYGDTSDGMGNWTCSVCGRHLGNGTAPMVCTGKPRAKGGR